MNKVDKITIIGLGYVGLPLAYAFAQRGYNVIGFDINRERVNELNDGFDRTLELTKEQLLEIDQKIIYTCEEEELRKASVYIVTVPTPIDKNNQPNLLPLIKSSQMIGKFLKKDDIVIYESTVYPGVTEEICVPELEKVSGLKYNKDFFCGYSPERINPGDKKHTVTKIKKVTSGSTPEIAKKVDALYNSIIEAGTFLASSIKVAEASKVIENTQRDVNIALINELALIFDTMNIDTNEVIDAASTKWNFIPLRPGLVGGHCIGVDPYYLTFKAEELGYKPNLILGARQINNGMGKYIANKVIKLMIKKNININTSKVLILGIAFKENCPDIRNSKVVDMIQELKEFGCTVDVFDPVVDKNEVIKKYQIKLIDKSILNIKNYNAIILAVAHNDFNNLSIKKDKYLVVYDVKGLLKKTDVDKRL